MQVAIYSSHEFEEPFLREANRGHGHELHFLSVRLDHETVELAKGHGAVAIFSQDSADARVLERLREFDVRLVALRSAGFNHVDIEAAERLGISLLRVPAYSPSSVAEHAVGLMMVLNRKLHRAYARVREGNFQLEGLLGFDMLGKTVGVIGTGRIGLRLAQILQGFGCRLLAFDPAHPEGPGEFSLRYTSLEELLAESDIVSLHCPLTPETRHLIDAGAIARMKSGAMLINTSRGAVVETRALIQALKSGKLGAVGLDVYEEEGDLFFKDLSEEVLQDDVFARLLTFPNVIVTGHQAFFTREALSNIAATTIENITAWESGAVPRENVVGAELLAP